jgi:hypothetical protein
MQISRGLLSFARSLHNRIGQQSRMIGDSNITDAEYQRAVSDSDQAYSLAKYLGNHLQGIDRALWFQACGLGVHHIVT